MRYFTWKLELGSDVLWVIVGFGLYDGLISLLDLNCPKPSSQTPNITALGSNAFFMSSSIKFSMKQVLIFHVWVIFHNVMSVVYSQKIAKNEKKRKKSSKSFLLVLFQISNSSSLKSCLKEFLFLSTKIQIYPKPLGQSWKEPII